MDIDIEAYLRSLEAGIGLLPAALIAVALLAGPTVIWLLYRFVVQPRTSRYRPPQIGALWICTYCRSANELASSRCYRCHQEFEDFQIELIDPASGGMVTARLPEFDEPPLRPDRPPEPGHDIAAIGGRAPVAVGPGKPGVERPAATLVEGRSPSRVDRPAKPKAVDRPAKPKANRPAKPKANPLAKSKVDGPSKPKVERPAKPKVDSPRRAAAGHAAPTPLEVRFVHQPTPVAQDEVPAAHEAAR